MRNWLKATHDLIMSLPSWFMTALAAVFLSNSLAKVATGQDSSFFWNSHSAWVMVVVWGVLFASSVIEIVLDLIQDDLEEEIKDRGIEHS